MIIPLEIKKITDPAGKTDFRAVVYIEDAVKRPNTNVLLKDIEEEYTELVQKSKKLLKEIQRTKANRANASLHWSFGDLVIRFLQRLREKGYFLANIGPTLSRDIGLSKRYIGYHIQLREDYLDVKSISDEISWSRYQELLDVRDRQKRAILAKKILNGEITTRNELREFKKNI